jgi:hypothetical protein
MGRMKNQFLDSYALLLTENYETNPTSKGVSLEGQAVSPASFQATNTKLRNEPKNQVGANRENTKRTQGAKSKCGGIGGFACQPPSARQKLRNEPKISGPSAYGISETALTAFSKHFQLSLPDRLLRWAAPERAAYDAQYLDFP